MIIFKEAIPKTVMDPKSAFGEVLRLEVPKRAIYEALLFVAIMSTLLSFLFIKLVTLNVSNDVKSADDVLISLVSYLGSVDPLFLAFNQLIQIIFFTVVITYSGRIFKGSGTFFEALIGVIWIEFILLFVKLMQIVLFPVSLLLSFVIILPGTLWSLWAFAALASYIHGFESTLRTFLGGVVICFFIALIFSFF